MGPVVETLRALVVEANGQSCAIPLPDVVETLRPLKTEGVAGLPAFVLGYSRIRGNVVPVIDLGLLLGSGRLAQPRRFVTLHVGTRWVALAADAAERIVLLEKKAMGALPPLLQGEGAVTSIGSSDAELLVVLNASRLVPPAFWEHFESASPL